LKQLGHEIVDLSGGLADHELMRLQAGDLLHKVTSCWITPEKFRQIEKWYPFDETFAKIKLSASHSGTELFQQSFDGT